MQDSNRGEEAALLSINKQQSDARRERCMLGGLLLSVAAVIALTAVLIVTKNSKDSSSDDLPQPTVSNQNLWMTISASAIQYNAAQVRARLPPKTRIFAVLKNNAYGVGAVPIAQVLERNNSVTGFCVAKVSEAVELRRAGLTKPILNLALFAPGEEQLLLRFNVTQALFRWADAEALSKAAVAANKQAIVHIKVDTGMGRLGVLWPDAVNFTRRVLQLPNIVIEGVFTPLVEDPNKTDLLQLARLDPIVKALRPSLLPNLIVHAAASNAITEYAVGQIPAFDAVRPGMMLNGVYQDVQQRQEHKVDLRPAMTLKARVGLCKSWPANSSIGYNLQVFLPRPTRVCLVSIGYTDGISKILPKSGFRVILRGRWAPVLLVNAGLMFVSAGDPAASTDVRDGDEVVLVGSQGGLTIFPEDYGAATASGSVYEHFGHLSRAMPRILVP